MTAALIVCLVIIFVGLVALDIMDPGQEDDKR